MKLFRVLLVTTGAPAVVIRLKASVRLRFPFIPKTFLPTTNAVTDASQVSKPAIMNVNHTLDQDTSGGTWREESTGL